MKKTQPTAKKAAKAKPFDVRHMTRQELRDYNAGMQRIKDGEANMPPNDRPENSPDENAGSTE